MTIPQAPHGQYGIGGFASAWQGGDRLTVAAAGGIAPAFSGEVTMPSPVQFAAPPSTVQRNVDLMVSWSGGTSGQVGLLLMAEEHGAMNLQIYCIFAAASGNGVVPASMLQDIPAGAQGSIMGTDVSAETIINTDDFIMTILATADALGANAAVIFP